MKIISKFKDYYDFVAGHDTDPRKVYVREMKVVDYTFQGEKPNILSLHESPTYGNMYNFFMGEVWFCDQRYPYLQDVRLKLMYWDYEAIPERTKDLWEKVNSGSRRYDLTDHWGIKLSKKHKRYHWRYSSYLSDKEKDLNTKFNAPVIFSYIWDKRNVETVINGRLADVNFAAVKSPQDAFTEIYNWIPYIEPEMPSDPTDMSRFVNKGFDKKTSFRGK